MEGGKDGDLSQDARAKKKKNNNPCVDSQDKHWGGVR